MAMWSGPRNLSTAMMYSFAQRTDSTVVDEPFYAAYLAATGIQHPICEEIIQSGEVDHEKVARFCVGPNPGEKPLFYQKHMTKHMIPDFDRNWIDQVCNIFLIRDPARVIASYHAKQENLEFSDIGIQEQLELFDRVMQKSGSAPVVIDSADILAAPETMLRALCNAIGIEFQSNMLSWDTGPRAYDGIWAPHWYQSVWKSRGFSAPDQSPVQVPEHLLGLLERATPYFEQIKGWALGR